MVTCQLGMSTRKFFSNPDPNSAIIALAPLAFSSHDLIFNIPSKLFTKVANLSKPKIIWKIDTCYETISHDNRCNSDVNVSKIALNVWYPPINSH